MRADSGMEKARHLLWVLAFNAIDEATYTIYDNIQPAKIAALPTNGTYELSNKLVCNTLVRPT